MYKYLETYPLDKKKSSREMVEHFSLCKQKRFNVNNYGDN